jgi:Flp pilus assembly protein TadG
MSIRSRLESEQGSVAITGILLALALVMLIGTGVDIAHAFIVRSDLTAIADGAALTGSQQLDLQAWRQGTLALDPQHAQQAADDELAANPEISGSATAEPTSITVQAQQRFPTMILRLVGIPQLTVTATATATPKQP